MKQERNVGSDFAVSDRGDAAGLIYFLIVIAKHKKIILVTTLVAILLSVGGSLLLPNLYQASTKLLPPQQSQSTASVLLSQIGGMAGAAAGITGLKSPSDLYIGMLRSRTVADSVIAQFDLKKAYDTPSQEKARKKLEERTSISSGKDGLITITVEHSDKQLVAPIASAYVDHLLKLTRGLAITEAAQRRVFYERELERAKNNLANSEVLLSKTLASRGVTSVEAESKGILETSARIKAQVSAKEIQLNSMRAFMTSNNPAYKVVEEELNSLRAQAAKLDNGRGNDYSNRTNLEERGGLESVKILRDVKYYQMLYDLLAKQYEIARLDEAKDPGIIQVLDIAVEPERKSKPQRALIVILATLVAFFAAAFYAFAREAYQRMIASPTERIYVNELKSYLRFK